MIVAEPEDSVAVKCRLTLKFVSVKPEFVVVFNVLILLLGNLNIAIFLFEPCNLPRFLIPCVFVDTSEAPTAVDNCKLVFEEIDSTIFVTEAPASVVNVIVSPICNSVLNKVPNPVTVVPLFATEKLPKIGKFSPNVASIAVSAVYVGEPAIPNCLTEVKSKVRAPLNP